MMMILARITMIMKRVNLSGTMRLREKELGETSSFILSQQVLRMQEWFFVFPSVLTVQIPFSLDQVSTTRSGSSMGENSLYFVFFLPLYQVRRWLLIVWTMCIHFNIWSVKSSVENIIDMPLRQKFQLEHETSKNFSDCEEACSFWLKPNLLQVETQICGF